MAATPGRSRRSVAPAAAPSTPRTTQRKLALRRTEAAALTVPEDVPVALPTTPTTTSAQPSPAKKTPAPAQGSEDEPPSKVAKVEAATAAAETSDKENGEEAPKEKTVRGGGGGCLKLNKTCDLLKLFPR